MPAVATRQSARVHVQSPDGRNEWHDVSEDDSLIVGSSQSCRVRLDSSDIASMHCMIRFENGKLTVQDWYTALGTFLNGERLQQPCSFAPGDELRIGDFRLTAEFVDSHLELQSGDQCRDRTSSSSELQPSGSRAERPDDQSSSVAAWARETGLDDANAAFHEETQPDDEQEPPRSASPSELKQLRLRITELELENDELRLQAEAFHESAGESVDAFDLEMVDLLKAEIQQLQHEVAQRDARIAELSETESAAEHDNDHHEADALVDRLDQLLQELQIGDERVATLEDLLRAADEATRAETEERRQLAAWVGDIEAKIGEREAEWQAAQAALQKRIDDLNSDRERFSERLKELGNKEGTASSAKLIEDLRDEVEALRRKLETAEAARQTLRKKIDDVEFQNSIEARDKYIEQKIREERLSLANDHAQIARERAEVARLKAQFESKATSDEHSVDEASCRVQAFREHLKDLHKEESKEKETKKLSSRLARLWKRLEG